MCNNDVQTVLRVKGKPSSAGAKTAFGFLYLLMFGLVCITINLFLRMSESAMTAFSKPAFFAAFVWDQRERVEITSVLLEDETKQNCLHLMTRSLPGANVTLCS